MEKTLKFLKENIVCGMSLDDMINTFEKMYEMPIENVPADDDLVLFETGTYKWADEKPLFMISLVRQVPNDEDEYIQIHLDVSYEPAPESQKLEECEWSDCLPEDIFDFTRNSKSVRYARSKNYVEVKVYIAET